MYRYTHEYVPRKDERKGLEFIAQVPLWAVYSTLQNLGVQIERVVLCGGCPDEIRAVYIYKRN
mgnify:FL=1